MKMDGDRFEGKDEFESGGFEAAEARRCAKFGCNPGFIVGYKDDPEEKNPIMELRRPANFRGADNPSRGASKKMNKKKASSRSKHRN